MTTNDLIFNIVGTVCFTIFMCIFYIAMFTDYFNKKNKL